MGIKHKKLKIEGVQFHPESILTTEGKLLMKNILDVAYFEKEIEYFMEIAYKEALKAEKYRRSQLEA